MYEDIKAYLPKFLSDSSEKELISELHAFPENIDSRFYSNPIRQENNFLQGDGFGEGIVCDIRNQRFKKAPCIVLSNSCDISPENERLYPTSVCYAPLVSFGKLIESLMHSGISKERIDTFNNDVRRQRISTIFFLPKGQGLEEEKLVFLDHVQNCPATFFHENQHASDKTFSLSNYGFYVLLLKLSIHFTRIRDGVDRVPL
jgi:hypothetical protein